MVPVTINGVSLYGVVTAGGVGTRVRLTLDEVEQLGLVPGRQLRVETAGHRGAFLLAAADDAPPFVWLRLRPLATVAV